MYVATHDTVLRLRGHEVMPIPLPANDRSQDIEDMAEAGGVLVLVTRWSVYERRANDWTCILGPDDRSFDAPVERLHKPWLTQPLEALTAQPTVDIDPDVLMQAPRALFGRKVRFLARIERGFEYAEVLAADGRHLRAWPRWHPQLSASNVPDTATLVGYWDFGGGFGHMSGAPNELFIVAVCPANTADCGE